MKILVVGDPLIDKYTFGNINRMSPEDSSIAILDVEKQEYRLGGCLNVCSNLKSLGPDSDIFVAAPMSGWTLEKVLEKKIYNSIEQLYSDNIRYSNNELVKERFVDAFYNQRLRVDNRMKFDDKTIQKFKRAFSRVNVDDFDCIVVSDYNKGSVGWFVVDKLKGLGCPIFVDTKQRDLSMWKDFEEVYIKINWNEFERSEHSSQIKNLIVTHGEDPVQLRRYSQLVKQFSVDLVENADVVGAGDVFFAGLVTNFLDTSNIEDAIKFAIKASRISVMKQGTCEINKDEVK